MPALAESYAALITRLSADRPLASLARHSGIDSALASDSLNSLKKDNRELVTSGEKEAERRMTLAVRQHFPDHAIVGEEHGYQPGGETRWVFDPVDGTSAMIRTAMAEAFALPLPDPRPSFGITIGVVAGDRAVMGMVTELRSSNGRLRAGDTWAGAEGQFTTLNGAPVTISTSSPALGEAVLASTVPRIMFGTVEKWSGFQALAEATKNCLPDQNCIGFMRLLKGGVDIVYEADLAYHDVSALVPILEGAGIKVSDGHGAPLAFPEAAIGREYTVLAAPPALHAQALDCIRKGVQPTKNTFGGNDPTYGYAAKF